MQTLRDPPALFVQYTAITRKGQYLLHAGSEWHARDLPPKVTGLAQPFSHFPQHNPGALWTTGRMSSGYFFKAWQFYSLCSTMVAKRTKGLGYKGAPPLSFQHTGRSQRKINKLKKIKTRTHTLMPAAVVQLMINTKCLVLMTSKSDPLSLAFIRPPPTPTAFRPRINNKFIT